MNKGGSSDVTTHLMVTVPLQDPSWAGWLTRGLRMLCEDPHPVSASKLSEILEAVIKDFEQNGLHPFHEIVHASTGDKTEIGTLEGTRPKVRSPN
jgi:hypothetical protein